MDGTLVERARAGDADAFDLLVRQRIDSVYRTALGMLGEAADARDATQETFVAAWRQLPTLRDPDRFDAWLHRITINFCRIALRKRRRVRELHLAADSQVQAAFGPIASVPDPGARDFDAAFERLSVEQRSILLAHHHDGRSVAEIAERLGIRPGTVKSRLHTARRALEKALDEERR